MSANTVITTSEKSIFNKIDCSLMQMGIEYTLFTRFKVGMEPDYSAYKKIKKLESLLNKKECLLEVELSDIRERLNKLTN